MPDSSQSPSLSDVLSRLDHLTNWERRPRGEMRVGLDPMIDLMQRLGNPHRSFRAIHVAGTKGKGSVSALIEAGMLRAGWRVGRYASPHVEHVSERVNVLGRPVEDVELARALGLVLDAYEAARAEATPGDGATWLDVITAAAFVIFRDAGLNWAVVEVGLGGRLDSTNVVFGEVAVVTNIELEHTEILGNTREAIAGEKVGILKPGAALATTLAETDAAGRVLQQRADKLGSLVLRTDFPHDASIADRNAALAGLVFDYLGQGGEHTRGGDEKGVPVGAWLLDRTVRESARLPGRMERFVFERRGAPGAAARAIPVMMDGAHVPFNIEAVLRDIARSSGFSGGCVAVVALAADKDARGFLTVLARYAVHTVLTEAPGSARSHPAAELQSLAASIGMASEAEPDARKALDRAAAVASESGGWLLVTGSLYLVGALRGIMSRGDD